MSISDFEDYTFHLGYLKTSRKQKYIQAIERFKTGAYRDKERVSKWLRFDREDMLLENQLSHTKDIIEN